LQSSETEFISPVGQRAILQLDALKSYSQEVQEKIDAANNLEVPNEEAENSFLTSTRFSDVEDLDESELRDAPNKDDSLFEGFSMTHVSMMPTNISMPKEGDATIASWRNDTQASPKSPRSEAWLCEKSGFTHLITSPKERSEPEMVSIIEEPEIQSNLLLPAESEFQRTNYLSTIAEESGASRNYSRETVTTDQSQESLSVFSPLQQEPEVETLTSDEKEMPVLPSKKMTRRTTLFRLPSKSPSSDEPDDVTTAPEVSEVNTGTVEDPAREPPQDNDPTEDEPHMMIPSTSSGRAVQVCQLVDDEKQYMSRLSGIFRINRKCYHF
jgi:hypothetical protein